MRKLCDAGDIIQAHLIRHALEAEDIPVYIQGEHLVGAVGELPATGVLAIWVPEAALPRATQLLRGMALWDLDPEQADAWIGDGGPRLA